MSEGLKIGDHVGVDLGDEPSNDTAQKYATKARAWLAGKVAAPEGNPPGGRVRTRAVDLKFSQRHHEVRVSLCLLEDPVGRTLGSIVFPHD